MNNSYIRDSNEFEELWEFVEKRHFYGLLSEQDSEYEEDIDNTLPQDQKTRLVRALNWGREQIDNLLREKYVMDTLDCNNAPDTLKRFNCQYAQYFLEERRYRGGELLSYNKGEIDSELERLARERSVLSLALGRQSSPLGLSQVSFSTQFDKSGQFDNIISSPEAGSLWPDQGNL